MVRGQVGKVGSPVSARLRVPQVGRARLYIRVVSAGTLALACLLVYLHVSHSGLGPTGAFPWASFAFILVLTWVAEAWNIRLGSGIELSASFLAFFLAGAIAGPLAAFLVAVAGQIYHFRRHALERSIWFAAAAWVLAAGTSLLYWGLLSAFGGAEGAGLLVVAAVALVAGVFYPLLNLLVVAPVGYLRRGIGIRRLWREAEKPFLPFHAFFLIISVGIVVIYQLYAPMTGGPGSLKSTLLVMLCLLPVVGLIFAFRAYSRQLMLAKRNSRLALRNERLALQAVVSLIYALDLKDNYTAQHSAAVAQWAGDIAEAMGLSEYEINMTHMASLLHDVGKIGVSEQLLRSSEKLSAENWADVESHTHHGYKILRQIDQFDEPATAVLHHHERYDGAGYPYGLAGERIPMASRIIAVADAYSAMISERPYGPPLPAEVAQAELEYRRATQFDPKVVDCFLDLLAKNGEAYAHGDLADFRLEVQAVKFLRNLPPEAEEEPEEQVEPEPETASPAEIGRRRAIASTGGVSTPAREARRHAQGRSSDDIMVTARGTRGTGTEAASTAAWSGAKAGTGAVAGGPGAAGGDSRGKEGDEAAGTLETRRVRAAAEVGEGDGSRGRDPLV
jgi:hypothetical protein